MGILVPKAFQSLIEKKTLLIFASLAYLLLLATSFLYKMYYDIYIYNKHFMIFQLEWCIGGS